MFEYLWYPWYLWLIGPSDFNHIIKRVLLEGRLMLTLVFNKLKKKPSDSDKFNVFFILFPTINGVYLMLIEE